jgi:hypothetical protein
MIYDANAFTSTLSIMSSAKETGLSASVLILIGPNWIIWEAQMKAYLRTQGLWQLVMGNEDKPEELPSGCAGQTARAATDTHPREKLSRPFRSLLQLSSKLAAKRGRIGIIRTIELLVSLP